MAFGNRMQSGATVVQSVAGVLVRLEGLFGDSGQPLSLGDSSSLSGDVTNPLACPAGTSINGVFGHTTTRVLLEIEITCTETPKPLAILTNDVRRMDSVREGYYHFAGLLAFKPVRDEDVSITVTEPLDYDHACLRHHPTGNAWVSQSSALAIQSDPTTT